MGPNIFGANPRAPYGAANAVHQLCRGHLWCGLSLCARPYSYGVLPRILGNISADSWHAQGMARQNIFGKLLAGIQNIWQHPQTIYENNRYTLLGRVLVLGAVVYDYQCECVTNGVFPLLRVISMGVRFFDFSVCVYLFRVGRWRW